jgi:hydroxypyruvate isomerase
MLRFSANLGFLWPDRPLLARIDAAAAAGFRAIELHWPYDVPPEEVRAACVRHGLALLGINTAKGGDDRLGLGALRGHEAEFQASVDRAVSWARRAGGRAIHVMAGFVPPNGRQAARDTFVANLKVAAGKANGLMLLLEPLNQGDAPGYLYSRVDEALDVMHQVGAVNIKLMFDGYHVGVTEGDVVERLVAAMPDIGHVQIAAVPSRHEPDEGTVDYHAVFSTLDRLGYDGWVGCEYKPRAATDAGLKWVKDMGLQL